MTRVNVYAYDETTAERRLDGWFDDERLTDDLKEARDWDGNNWRGRTSGMQINWQHLQRTARGRWVLDTNRRPEFNGPHEISFITDEAARAWLLTNDHDDVAERYFGPEVDEAASLDVLGRERERLEEQLRDNTAKARAALVAHRVGQTGGMSKSEAARQLRVTRPTVQSWLEEN